MYISWNQSTTPVNHLDRTADRLSPVTRQRRQVNERSKIFERASIEHSRWLQLRGRRPRRAAIDIEDANSLSVGAASPKARIESLSFFHITRWKTLVRELEVDELEHSFQSFQSEH